MTTKDDEGKASDEVVFPNRPETDSIDISSKEILLTFLTKWANGELPTANGARMGKGRARGRRPRVPMGTPLRPEPLQHEQLTRGRPISPSGRPIPLGRIHLWRPRNCRKRSRLDRVPPRGARTGRIESYTVGGQILISKGTSEASETEFVLGTSSGSGQRAAKNPSPSTSSWG